MASGMTIPDAIRHLFGINVASSSSHIKDKANSMVRNGLIKVIKETKPQRSPTYLDIGQQTVLFNALLLNAIFSDPKDVKKIFEDKAFRQRAAVISKQLFGQSNSLVGVALCNPSAKAFVSSLESDLDLFTTKLPNPFQVLPQLALGKNLNLLSALLSQAALMDPVDNLLLAYINGDLNKAMLIAEQLPSDNKEVALLVQHIQKQQQEALEFNDLLDIFQKI